MKKILVTMSAVLSFAALAQTPASSCEAQAAEKKLAGAAKTSFIKKCERDMAAASSPSDAQASCEKTAAEKKLAGAAKNSFVNKCVRDASEAKK
jgi:hypothetical protein